MKFIVYDTYGINMIIVGHPYDDNGSLGRYEFSDCELSQVPE